MGKEIRVDFGFFFSFFSLIFLLYFYFIFDFIIVYFFVFLVFGRGGIWGGNGRVSVVK